MSAYRKPHLKLFTGIAASCMALVIALSHAPALVGASDAADDQVFSASVNFPLNEIQDGQFCQAYANVFGGNAPYTYQWTGQFSGPGGTPSGMISGFVSSSRPDWLKVTVTDQNNDVATDSIHVNIGDTFNEECGI